MFTPIVNIIRITSLISTFYFVDTSRIECLQYRVGTEQSKTEWIKESIDGRRSDVEGWLYHSLDCPLHSFSEEKFCKKAIGCGRSVLLVGDSTLKVWSMGVFRHIVNFTEISSACPQVAECLRDASGQCINYWQRDAIRNLQLCHDYCQSHQLVNITFIRHDFLTGRHGRKWNKDSICEHWLQAAPAYDYIVISFGPHIQSILDFPFMQARGNKSYKNILQLSSAQLVGQMLQAGLSRGDSLIIYRTGPHGSANFTQNCEARPRDTISPIEDSFHWDQIPLANDIYVKSLKRAFGDRLLVMDTQSLLGKIWSCRVDPMHFDASTKASPILLEWLIFYNILLEAHHPEGMMHAQHAIGTSKSGAAALSTAIGGNLSPHYGVALLMSVFLFFCIFLHRICTKIVWWVAFGWYLLFTSIEYNAFHWWVTFNILRHWTRFAFISAVAFKSGVVHGPTTAVPSLSVGKKSSFPFAIGCSDPDTCKFGTGVITNTFLYLVVQLVE